jgi:hypothetical protein
MRVTRDNGVPKYFHPEDASGIAPCDSLYIHALL